MLRTILLTTAIFISSSLVYLPSDPGIEGLIYDFQKETKCSNVSVAVFDNGKTDHYGDKEGLYQIGSMTKAFTGLAIQKLIDEGKIGPEDKLSDLIPGFKAYYDSAEEEISIDDLLRQKSGFTNSEKDYPSAKESMTLDEWAGTISGSELRSKPGDEYSYSNVNYNLLGLIIEKVSGRSYKDYMETEILKPLGLASTTAGVPSDKDLIIEGTRLGFRNVFGHEVPVKVASIPSGYFYSNTEDISCWMKAWIEGKDESITNVLSLLHDKGDYYAGWELFEDDVIGHSGGTPDYSSRIVFSPKDGIGVIVLTNLNVAASTDSLCNSIFSILNGSGRIKLDCDVWTVFDRIFTAVSAAGAAFIVLVFFVKKKGFLIGAGAFIALIIILMLILFPLIFGAGLDEIILTWAPLSLPAGMMILIADLISIMIRIFTVKVNADRTKTG